MNYLQQWDHCLAAATAFVFQTLLLSLRFSQVQLANVPAVWTKQWLNLVVQRVTVTFRLPYLDIDHF